MVCTLSSGWCLPPPVRFRQCILSRFQDGRKVRSFHVFPLSTPPRISLAAPPSPRSLSSTGSRGNAPRCAFRGEGPRFVAAARTGCSRHVLEAPRGDGPDGAGPSQDAAVLFLCLTQRRHRTNRSFAFLSWPSFAEPTQIVGFSIAAVKNYTYFPFEMENI